MVPSKKLNRDEALLRQVWLNLLSNAVKFTQKTEHPKLVLLDLKLPLLDGKEVLSELRARPLTQSLPVVILSSSLKTTDVKECFALGANSYVAKPIDYDHYGEMLRQLALYWSQVNVIPD